MGRLPGLRTPEPACRAVLIADMPMGSIVVDGEKGPGLAEDVLLDDLDVARADLRNDGNVAVEAFGEDE